MTRDDRQSAGLPNRRILLLGASNLVLGIPTVVNIARGIWQQPLEIVAAMGHGRSYGNESWVLGRSLPGILSSGIWESLADSRPVPTTALITDIGNDILYGVPVSRISEWLEQCFEQIAPLAEKIVVTELPLESVKSLSQRKFSLIRKVFFPQSQLSHSEAIAFAYLLNDVVNQLARRYDAVIVKPQNDWYGFDPIHIRRCQVKEAWKKILSPWADDGEPVPAAGNFRQSLYLRCLRPRMRRLFGWTQRKKQPAGKLRDGSTVAYY